MISEFKPHKRPLGIVLITVYLFLSGVSSPFILTGSPIVETALFGAVLIFFILLGILYLVGCYGLWTWQTWGPSLAIVLLMVSILLAFLDLLIRIRKFILTDSPIETQYVLFTVIGIVIDVVILRYLFKPKIQELFR